MNLPQLVPIPNLGVNLPDIPDNQAWALNRDTNTIVLIEFIYHTMPTGMVVQQNNNSTIEESLLSFGNQLQALTNRIDGLEIALNTTLNSI